MVEAELLAPAAVRAFLLEGLRPLPPCPVPLAEAAGLVLAERVVAPFDIPGFDNAAMDGFAVRAADTRRAPVRLPIGGEAPAGQPPGRLRPGEAVAIATGGPVPEGADTVVPVEEATVEDGAVLVTEAVEPGRHVRVRGEDLTRGEVVLEAGAALGPGQLAAAAALGLTEVRAHPRPRVAILPTGDEIRPPGSPRAPGQVYDAVSAPLAALLRELGCVPLPRPIAPDDPSRLTEAVRQGAAKADVVLTVGGVSMGHRDLVRRLDGDVRAVRVALRPAKPFAFGTLFGVPLFGLPGNPASALASFEELVRPVLLVLLGRPPALRPHLRATLGEPLTQHPGRLHLIRARVWREGGRLWARGAGRQGAGMIHSLARANAWAIIPADVSSLPAGVEIDVRMMESGP